jgi:hypothetical protein
LFTNVSIVLALVVANFATLFARQCAVRTITAPLRANQSLAFTYRAGLVTRNPAGPDPALDLATVLSIVSASAAIAVLGEGLGGSRQKQCDGA